MSNIISFAYLSFMFSSLFIFVSSSLFFFWGGGLRGGDRVGSNE